MRGDLFDDTDGVTKKEVDEVKDPGSELFDEDSIAVIRRPCRHVAAHVEEDPGLMSRRRVRGEKKPRVPDC